MGNSTFRTIKVDYVEGIAAQPNIVTNSSAEINTAGWATYNDGAVAVPISMTGGSATQLTFSRTTTSGEALHEDASFKIVKAAANAQGQGLSTTVTVPEAYRGQNLTIAFPYKIISGSVSSGDLKVYVYDVTNSAVITPTNNDVTGTRGVVTATVAIPATCASARVGFHFATTSATAVTYSFDNFQMFYSIAATSSSGGGLASVAPGSVINANYTVVSGDNGRTLNVDTSGGVVMIQLPAPSSGFKVTIKDYKGTSTGNNIVIKRNGSELIDFVGSDDTINENYRAVSLVSDGTDWYRVASFAGIAPAFAAIGLFAGGRAVSTTYDTIEYIQIATTANSNSFGSLVTARRYLGGCSSATRGVYGGGSAPTAQNIIDYVVFSTLGNATTFGNLTNSRANIAGSGSSTRGIFSGSGTGTNTIDYITIASAGNATSFGTMTVARDFVASCSDPTRSIFAGGNTGSVSGVIDYVTIATTSNATSFGTLSLNRDSAAACSSPTRGVIGGGTSGTASSVIDYVTIATTGNATSFGTLTISRDSPGACSSNLRGVFAGGENTAGTEQSRIDYVQIATTGNATTFGALGTPRFGLSGTSNSHGGL